LLPKDWTAQHEKPAAFMVAQRRGVHGNGTGGKGRVSRDLRRQSSEAVEEELRSDRVRQMSGLVAEWVERMETISFARTIYPDAAAMHLGSAPASEMFGHERERQRRHTSDREEQNGAALERCVPETNVDPSARACRAQSRLLRCAGRVYPVIL
jgi:hypothetical protein